MGLVLQSNGFGTPSASGSPQVRGGGGGARVQHSLYSHVQSAQVIAACSSAVSGRSISLGSSAQSKGSSSFPSASMSAQVGLGMRETLA